MNKDEEDKKWRKEVAFEVLKTELSTEEEINAMEEEEMLMKVESRLVYHPEKARLDLGKKVADNKGNAHVMLTKGVPKFQN